MFVRPCWVPNSPDDILRMMEQNPWALLVSQGPDGPLATNLPMLIEQGTPQGGDLVLVSHLAQANAHYIALRQSSSFVLVIFEGPWSYVTASWYPQRQMPSTYYYTAVHCHGSIEFQDEAALERSLEDIVQRMEAGYAGGWKTSEIPRSEITRRLAAIAGFRVKVSRVEAKFKLGQDEPLRDALAVADVLAAHTSPQDQKLAAMIRAQNQGRK